MAILKWGTGFVLVLAAAIGLLWWAIGGVVLGVIFGAVTLLAIIVTTFVLGAYFAAGFLERGAGIAHNSYQSASRPHAGAEAKALQLLGKMMDAVSVDQPARLLKNDGYPALPHNTQPEAEEGQYSFVIHNLEDEPRDIQ